MNKCALRPSVERRINQNYLQMHKVCQSHHVLGLHLSKRDYYEVIGHGKLSHYQNNYRVTKEIFKM